MVQDNRKGEQSMFNINLPWADKARLHLVLKPLFKRNILDVSFGPDVIELPYGTFYFVIGWLRDHAYHGLAEVLLRAI